MSFSTLLAAIGLAATLLAAPAGLRADDGHDHGDSPAAATGPALPRFAATTELFELVGVLDGRRITLYLDRAADNSPVENAEIELEIGSEKLKAVRHGADAFEVELAAAPGAGVLPITAMVTAGGDVDLLAAALDIHEVAHAEGEAGPGTAWASYAGWAAGGIVTLLALVALFRRRPAPQPQRAGGAA